MGTVTVSCRAKKLFSPISTLLKKYKADGVESITGVFGFVEEYSPLYGGRIFKSGEISHRDYEWLRSKGMQLKLLLSNDTVSKKHYEETRPLLDYYHEKENAVVIVNDKLAKWIKRDYPQYLLEASVIKNTKFSEIDNVLEMYDTLVLSMHMNDDLEELEKIKNKDKIILFVNAGCAYKCPSKICYPSISKINRNKGVGEPRCSESFISRPKFPNVINLHNFDLNIFKRMGFSNFKVLPNMG